MFERITELALNQSYFFKVIYREGGAGFAATLELTPDLITFKVMTERSCDLSWNAVEAECDDLNNKFILKGLYCVGSRSATISDIPSVGFFEIEFTVESVVFCCGQGPIDGKFEALQIHSQTVNDWVGHTTTQEKILEANHRNEDVQPFLTEFLAEANDNEVIGVQYNGTYSHSPLSYEQSFSFPPSLFYTLGSEENVRSPFSAYTKIYNLLAFLTGVEPSVQRVGLEYDCYGRTGRGSLYFVNDSLKPKRSDTYIMFPLGKDPRFESWGLAPFPLTSFSLYFDPDSDLSDILAKYVKYRNMGNVEDRLLGYFRLLEKHCYKQKNYLPEELFVRFSRIAKGWTKANGLKSKDVKSFEAGLKRFNDKKYNTHKCVTDFLHSLPEQVQRGLGITSDLLTTICKLRNDITHANKYHADENKIHACTAYVHHLLIFAILEKLNVVLNDVSKLTGRLRNN
jgi:hypothetical protein